MSLPATDLGSVAGFVMSSDGVPIEGASVVIYKHTGLISSADKNAGYVDDYTLTESDCSYSLMVFHRVYIGSRLHIQTELFK
jgi:hypothetical protein